jgi:hypothetical protein
VELEIIKTKQKHITVSHGEAWRGGDALAAATSTFTSGRSLQPRRCCGVFIDGGDVSCGSADAGAVFCGVQISCPLGSAAGADDVVTGPTPRVAVAGPRDNNRACSCGGRDIEEGPPLPPSVQDGAARKAGWAGGGCTPERRSGEARNVGAGPKIGLLKERNSSARESGGADDVGSGAAEGRSISRSLVREYGTRIGVLVVLLLLWKLKLLLELR